MAERAFLIAYDISDNRRRNRVAKYLEARGERLQKSLFVCRLGPRSARRLRVTLEAMIQRGADRLMIEPMAGQIFQTPHAVIV
jgi:CRISPR-associated protein Cas2